MTGQTLVVNYISKISSESCQKRATELLIYPIVSQYVQEFNKIRNTNILKKRESEGQDMMTWRDDLTWWHGLTAVL